MTTDIRIATDFSRHPGGRFRADGPFNGELFRKKFLVPPLLRGERVIVHMDGARGYGSSFLEEAFGGLVRAEGFEKEFVLERIQIEASNATLAREIAEYINGFAPDGESTSAADLLASAQLELQRKLLELQAIARESVNTAPEAPAESKEYGEAPADEGSDVEKAPSSTAHRH